MAKKASESNGLMPGPSIMGAKTHERWKAEREAKPFTSSVAEPHATGSQAHSCARKIAFNAFGVRRSEPEREWNVVVFKIGQRVHDFIQQTLVEEFGASTEVRVDMRPLAYVTGYADALVPMHPLTAEAGNTVVEVKSMAQYAFDLATGVKGNSPGPKLEHIAQGAMYGLKLNAKWLWIIYYGKDKGHTAEWLLGMDDPLEQFDGLTPRQIAEAEVERLAVILKEGNDGKLPPREIPGFGVVVDPLIDNRNDPNYCWNCAYCDWRTTCASAKDDATLDELLAPPAMATTDDEGDGMRRLQVRKRIERLNDEQRKAVAARWPKGVPTLREDGHTQEQLDLIVDVLDRVCGFEVDSLDRDAPPDEGMAMTDEDIEAIRRFVKELPSDAALIFGMLGKQAFDAGTPVELAKVRSERRFEITRAALRLAAFTGDNYADDTTLELLTPFFDGHIPTTATPGAVLSAMTIDEARKVAAVLDSLIAGTTKATYDGGHLTIVPAA